MLAGEGGGLAPARGPGGGGDLAGVDCAVTFLVGVAAAHAACQRQLGTIVVHVQPRDDYLAAVGNDTLQGNLYVVGLGWAFDSPRLRTGQDLVHLAAALVGIGALAHVWFRKDA